MNNRGGNPMSATKSLTCPRCAIHADSVIVQDSGRWARSLEQWWRSHSSNVRMTMLYTGSTISFLILSFIPQILPVIILRAVMGVVALLVIPGALLGRLLIPEDLRNLGTSTVLGVMLTVLEVQVAFTVSLNWGFQMPLLFWIVLLNSIAALAVFLLLCHSNAADEAETGLAIGNRKLTSIVVIGLSLRLALMLLNQDSLAPDACLYADFARGIVDGRFSSSVLNDSAVIALWNGTQYVAHSAVTYIFAVSWLILPPGTSGPMLIVTLLGNLLIIPVYWIVKRCFSETAGLWTALILAVHPTFVFHSSIGYGPEIVSLVLMLYGINILAVEKQRSFRAFLISGLLIGLADIIWSPNFYIACLTLPLVLIALKTVDRTQFLALQAVMLIVFMASYSYENLMIFIICWGGIIGFLLLMRKRAPHLGTHIFLPFLAGILTIVSFWRWPMQLLGISTQLQGSNPVPNAMPVIPSPNLALQITTPWSGLISAILSNITPELLGRFAFFVAFHLTIVLTVVLLLGLLRGKNRSTSLAFVLAAAISAAGTLKVFGLFSKETLIPIYIFSDSRFFLFLVVMCIISLGAYFAKFAANTDSKHSLIDTKMGMTRRQQKCIVVFSLIVIGFVPSYLAMPSGLALINIEERYAWSGLPSAVSEIGDDSTVFLVDRAREFAWFTNRKSAVLDLSNMRLPYANASRELLSLATNFGTDYLIADGYTLAHWKTLDFLLLEPISIGTSVILGDLEIVEFYESSNTISAPALTLIAQTEPNEFGSYCRVFRFDTANFTRFRDVSMLDFGWSASNFGSITNASGEVRLTIGNDQSSTNTFRPEGFDFGQMVNSGFLLLDLEVVSATISRIEVWDENGIILRNAEYLGNSLYYCPLGEITIGDIRIVIEGSSGDSIIVRSISVWQVENP